MSHYRRRAGLCAPVHFSPSARLILGATLLCLTAETVAQTAVIPPPAAAPTVTTLFPDKGYQKGLKFDDQLRIGKPIPDDQALTFTASDAIDGVVEREMKLQGRAQIRRGGTVMKADQITYDPDSDTANLIGNAELVKDAVVFTGPKARLRVDAREGGMEDVTYEFRDSRVRGRADKLTVASADTFKLEKPIYTTCAPDNLDWYFSASQLDLDQEQRTMIVKDGVMRFFDVPILYLPYLSLPTSNQRRSGFLAPVAGYSTTNGIDVTEPYYMDIAPNRDLLILPRYMSNRGLQLGGNLRYLEPKYAGTLQADILNDRTTNSLRWKYDLQHRESILPGWNAFANVAKVSDNTYPIDFSRSIAGAVTTQFRQELGTSYAMPANSVLGGWSFTARTLTFQTLQPDPASIVGAPYNILPEIKASYVKNNFLNLPTAGAFKGPDAYFNADFTRFQYNIAGNLAGTAPGPYSDASRTVIKGGITASQTTPGYYLTPKIFFQANNYSAVSSTPGAAPAQGFIIPTITLDSGMAFEREATELKGFFGRDMLLTVEPRAYYVYTPYVNQSNVPNFDTGDQGFGISQIFAPNTFIGNDRVSDANKATLGITSRLLDAQTGAERATVIVAQQQQFQGQKVSTSTTVQNPSTYSDTLGAGTVRLPGNFNLDLFGQFNTQLSRFVQSSVGAGWNPTPGRLINFGYRNVWTVPVPGVSAGATTTDQYSAYGQWPITKHVSVMGRWGYDALASKTLNTMAAVEYDQDCWVIRMAYSQVLTNAATNTQILFQLEFKGFGGIGNNPVDIMKLNIPGYKPAPQALPPSSFENYK